MQGNSYIVSSLDVQERVAHVRQCTVDYHTATEEENAEGALPSLDRFTLRLLASFR